jgi:hypothetical protein
MKETYLTFEELTYLINKYKIPHNVRLQSDSGWECNETDMCGIYYNKEKNIIIFTQTFDKFEREYTEENGWTKLIN